MDRRIPHRCRWLIGLYAVSCVGGCALPDYHLPHGFSSTYYRKLQQSGQFNTVATPPLVEEPTPGSRPWFGAAPSDAPPAAAP